MTEAKNKNDTHIQDMLALERTSAWPNLSLADRKLTHRLLLLTRDMLLRKNKTPDSLLFTACVKSVKKQDTSPESLAECCSSSYSEKDRPHCRIILEEKINITSAFLAAQEPQMVASVIQEVLGEKPRGWKRYLKHIGAGGVGIIALLMLVANNSANVMDKEKLREKRERSKELIQQQRSIIHRQKEDMKKWQQRQNNKAEHGRAITSYLIPLSLALNMGYLASFVRPEVDKSAPSPPEGARIEGAGSAASSSPDASSSGIIERTQGTDSHVVALNSFDF